MNPSSLLLRRGAWWLPVLVLVPVLLLALQGLTFRAHAAGLDWVDGGDDQLCLQDDVGAALSHSEIEQCSPIIGCETGETAGKPWIRFPTRNGVWQPRDEYKSYTVLYAGDPVTPTPTPTPKPSTKPTPKPSTKPTPKPTSGTKPNTSHGSGSGSGTSTPQPTATSTTSTALDTELGITGDETAVEGAPTAPAAPTVTVDGSTVTVSWTATADADLEGVTGYTLRFSGADPVTTDATTLSHTFKDLDDGNYRAAVRAVNTAGESVSSPPSDIATVGTPIAEVQGDLAVTGDLEPGSTVTVSGTGYAPNVPELALELHSTPVSLGTVATDENGDFSTDVTLPADVPAGSHEIVVLYDGTQVTATPIEVTAAVAAAAAPTAAKAEAESVPPLTGVAILAALAALGLLALLWHTAVGRRRRPQHSDRDWYPETYAETSPETYPESAPSPALVPAGRAPEVI